MDKRVRNHVALLGFELEGSWGSGDKNGMYPWHLDPKHLKAAQDSSVSGLPDWSGEIVSVPLSPEKAWPLILAHYPKEANSSCGIHVHMSFRKKFDYQLLMDSADYPNTILRALQEWGTQQKKLPIGTDERFAGTNRYCLNEFAPDAQARQTRRIRDRSQPGHRYTVLNYAHNQYGTIECRVLPVFKTGAQAVEAIQLILGVTNQYLVQHAKRDQWAIETLTLPNTIQEIIESCV